VYGNPLARTSPLAAALPVVGFRPAVVVTLTVGHADGGHQYDAHRPAAQGGEDVSDSPVIDALRAPLAAAVRAVREDNRVHAVDRGGQCVGACEVAADDLRVGKQSACFSGIAGEGPYGVALPDCFRHDETPDAASGTDHEYGHAWVAHAGTTSSIARSAFSLRGTSVIHETERWRQPSIPFVVTRFCVFSGLLWRRLRFRRPLHIAGSIRSRRSFTVDHAPSLGHEKWTAAQIRKSLCVKGLRSC
jgi:hypothetical protein